MKITTIIEKYWIAATIWSLLIITFLSLYPLPELPDVPGEDKTFTL
ncbi:MAG: hypothetical protein JXQ90_09630 [Cyclobacteriaceae bacterium]